LGRSGGVGGAGVGASRSSESLSSPVERLEIDVVGASPSGAGAGGGDVFFAAPSTTTTHAGAAFTGAGIESHRPTTPLTPGSITPSPGAVGSSSTASRMLAPHFAKMTPLLIASTTTTSTTPVVAPPAVAKKEARNPLMVLAEAAALLAGNDD